MAGDIITRATPATARLDVVHAELVGKEVAPTTEPIFRTLDLTAVTGPIRGICFMGADFMAVECLLVSMAQAGDFTVLVSTVLDFTAQATVA